MGNDLSTKWSKDRIKEEVIQALSDRSQAWNNAELDHISLEDVSGYGGNCTYHVSINNGEEEVCLHLIGAGSINLHIQHSATTAFANAKVGPRRITGSDNLFINEWIQNSRPLKRDDINGKLARKLGILLAHVHQVNKEWYSKHYDELQKEYPSLASVSQASSFWYLTTRNWPRIFRKKHASTMYVWLKRLSELHSLFTEAEVKPVTPAGKNVVTTHGDFQLRNILLVENDQNDEDNQLMVIDFESTHVSHAIQDISYLFWTKPFEKAEEKLAFASYYLKEMGFHSADSDAFNLVLDAERCVLSGGFRTKIFKEFVNIEDGQTSVDLLSCTTYKDLIAEKALSDDIMANDIVENTLENCQAFSCMNQYIGDPDTYGTLVTVQDGVSTKLPIDLQPKNKFLINWDGTIMPKEVDRWKGLVLGVNKSGNVILTNHCNGEERLQLSKEVMKVLPITGFTAPTSKPVPLLLKGNHSGKAIVRSSKQGELYWNNWIWLAVGSSDDAVDVYFEKNGAIRFADKPDQGFVCELGRHDNGRRVNSYQFQDAKCHQFVRNADDTISPLENLEVILGCVDGFVKQYKKDEVDSSSKLVFDLPADIGPTPDEIHLIDKKNKENKCVSVTHSYQLLLDSHPGKAIGIAPLEVPSDLKQILEKRDAVMSRYKLFLCDEVDAPVMTINSSEFSYIQSNYSVADTVETGLKDNSNSQFVAVGLF